MPGTRVAGIALRARGGLALTLLQSLPVKGRAPLTGYTRQQFGPAWADVDSNGCDTRDDVLAAQLTRVELTDACRVSAGAEVDPYTGKSLYYVRGRSTVDIDHIVALGDAWQTGAQQLSPTTRRAFANDPLNLLAVSSAANRRKGDADAASWLPRRSYRCNYVARQVAVKAKYGLWTTAAEHSVIAGLLAGCPGQTAPTAEAPRALAPPAPLPTAPARSTPTVAPAPTPTPTPTRFTPKPTATTHRSATTHHSATPTRSSAPPLAHSCTKTASGSCIRGGEFCRQALYGRTGTDAEGRTYTCMGDHVHPHWES